MKRGINLIVYLSFITILMLIITPANISNNNNSMDVFSFMDFLPPQTSGFKPTHWCDVQIPETE